MSVNVKWVSKPFHHAGVIFTVPWAKGELSKTDSTGLYDDKDNMIGADVKNLAYWDDGSVKWTSYKGCLSGNNAYYVKKTEKSATANNSIVKLATENCIVIDTGKCEIELLKQECFINFIKRNDTVVVSGAHAVLLMDGRTEKLRCDISSLRVEEDGENSCTIKIEGDHQGQMPFHLRLYFFKNQSDIKGVYTFFYDGDPNKDFIKGLGLEFDIPLCGEFYNRNIRIAGETGFYIDAPLSLNTGKTKGEYKKYQTWLAAQRNGQITVFSKSDEDFKNIVLDGAVFGDFSLNQDFDNHYSIYKRTREGFSKIKAMDGERSLGLIYIADEAKGISLGLKDFWQKYPAKLEVQNMLGESANLKVWFWSPDSQPMDLRHYDDKSHVLSAYEGSTELRSSPYGIANTSEFSLNCYFENISHDSLLEVAREVQNPPAAVCEPDRYIHTKVFGDLEIKDNLLYQEFIRYQNMGINFIKTEIEQWKWYGYWNYGDIMRLYNTVRHSWGFDLGGWAWNNSEIVPNMWLWYAFIQTGDKDLYKLAISFTRHASEVDQYHFGQYKGLGSRHNVVHWGCGCKEARVSMAGLHRFAYYLTADNRIGDILDEVADADYAVLRIDPLREILPQDQYKTHVRSSPDWAAFCSNWLTKWERYEDTKYRDKILKGIECLKHTPYGFRSGPIFGYDPETGELFHMGDENQSYHMNNCFGGLYVLLEIAQIIDDPVWNDILSDFGAFYLMDFEEKKKIKPHIRDEKNYAMKESVIPLAAYSAYHTKDAELAAKVLDMLFISGLDSIIGTPKVIDTADVPSAILEYGENSNSGIGLWYMAAMYALRYIKVQKRDDKYVPIFHNGFL